MKKKRVLIIEDRKDLRDLLEAGLGLFGLATLTAESAQQAWQVLAESGDVDVVLLDIQLEGGQNGLEFGLELKKARREWPPEFLVYSVRTEPDYYDLAMKLGAAGYLRKTVYGGAPEEVELPPRIEVLAEHIRALALRRALHSERPGMAERLRKIAESSSTQEKALERFCRDVLVQEIHDALGERFVLLASYRGDHLWFSGTVPVPPAPVITRLRDTVQSRLTDTEPLVVSLSSLMPDTSSLGEEALVSLGALDGAAFTVLADARDISLTLGLLPGDRFVKSPKSQASVLDRYLQREVIAHLFHITELWSKLEQKRQVQLKATSQFCLYEGQEILSILYDADRGSEEGGGSHAIARLRTVAAEMHNAGEILSQFGQADDSGEWRKGTRIHMATLIGRVWSGEVSPRLRLLGEDALQLDGDCAASDREDRAGRAVSQILGWMGRRLVRYGVRNEKPALYVRCAPADTPARVQIQFEERSSRQLSPELRKVLFEPFYAQGAGGSPGDRADADRRLGLYLAKTLAHIGGGVLLDRSDDLGGPVGHRFVLELPAALDA